MTTETITVSIRKLIPESANNVITDTETETLRSSAVYLGAEDSEENYKEIPADTPLPEVKETEDK